MATKSFGTTFNITTKYGKKNFIKAMENSSFQKDNKTNNIKNYMADPTFINKFMKNINGN